MNLLRYKFLSTEIDAITQDDVYQAIAEAVDTGQRRVIANHNLHSLYLYHRDRRFAQFYRRSDCIYVDGMVVIFLARALGLPFRKEHRTTFLDSLDDLMAEIVRHDWRVFYLGSKPGVSERGAEEMRRRFKGLRIATMHGYFDGRPGSPENSSVIEAINAFQPNLLMVGMGMPRQELWVLDNLESISANAIITCGATMDYFTGEIASPPRWAGPLGLYGFTRLLSEPRRLWKRYLIEPWVVLGLFLRDLLRTPKTDRQRMIVLTRAGERVGNE